MYSVVQIQSDNMKRFSSNRKVFCEFDHEMSLDPKMEARLVLCAKFGVGAMNATPGFICAVQFEASHFSESRLERAELSSLITIVAV